MHKKLGIFAVLITSLFIGVPVDGFAARTKTETTVTTGSSPQIYVSTQRRRRSRRGTYWRNGRSYRNYGQYRRSVVGTRRYRTVTRYYWDGGRRRTRQVRVYY